MVLILEGQRKESRKKLCGISHVVINMRITGSEQQQKIKTVSLTLLSLEFLSPAGN